jgi:hypothetical protein
MADYDEIGDDVVKGMVEKAIAAHEQYLAQFDTAYQNRYLIRKVPVTAWIGHGTSGKDFGAKLFYERIGGVYAGSCSSAIAPMVGYCLRQSTEEAFRTRHANRGWWRRFCDEFRSKDAAKLIRMCLALGDCIVGTRARAEFAELRKLRERPLRIWVRNDGVEKDPTLEVTEEECDLTIINDMTDNFKNKVWALADSMAWR